MPSRIYFWSVIAVFLSCSLFSKPSLYQQGLDHYNRQDFAEALRLFNLYYSQSPQGDSTLYYLYDCYQKLGQTEKSIAVLERLADRESLNENVYFNLFSYYQEECEYHKQYQLVLNASSRVRQQFDQRYHLTRRLLAELLTGAASRVQTRDPVGYVLTHGFLTVFPDGQFYGYDTVTIANLIVALDRLVASDYPQKFHVVGNLSAHSYLYVPYMRLVEQGILLFDPELDPEKHAPISMAVNALSNLKNRGMLH